MNLSVVPSSVQGSERPVLPPNEPLAGPVPWKTLGRITQNGSGQAICPWRAGGYLPARTDKNPTRCVRPLASHFVRRQDFAAWPDWPAVPWGPDRMVRRAFGKRTGKADLVPKLQLGNLRAES